MGDTSRGRRAGQILGGGIGRLRDGGGGVISEQRKDREEGLIGMRDEDKAGNEE